MDGFTLYRDEFKEALINLENVLKICIEMNFCLSNEICELMMDEGVVLRHNVSEKRNHSRSYKDLSYNQSTSPT